MKIGDIIMVVNGDSVDEKDLDEVSDRIRGPEGTKVELEVKGLKGGIRRFKSFVIRLKFQVLSLPLWMKIELRTYILLNLLKVAEKK